MKKQKKKDWLTPIFCITALGIGAFEISYICYLLWSWILKG